MRRSIYGRFQGSGQNGVTGLAQMQAVADVIIGAELAGAEGLQRDAVAALLAELDAGGIEVRDLGIRDQLSIGRLESRLLDRQDPEKVEPRLLRQRRQEPPVVRAHSLAGVIDEVVDSDLENDSLCPSERAIGGDAISECAAGIAAYAEIEHAGSDHGSIEPLDDAVAEQNDRPIGRRNVLGKQLRETGSIPGIGRGIWHGSPRSKAHFGLRQFQKNDGCGDADQQPEH